MILITGASGFLGKALCAYLDRIKEPYQSIQHSWDLDLRAPVDTGYCISSAVHDEGVETVIHLAYPRTNGIQTSVSTPADLAHDGLLIDMNVIRACAVAKVQKLICMGTTCAYPLVVPYPTDESQLLAGAPESTNAAYGHAKRMQGALLEAYRRQYGLQYTQLILSNLYGPGELSGHVIPATVRKVLKAQAEGLPSIDVWGDGRATREFLYVDDAVEAIWQAHVYGALNQGVNIGSGIEVAIADLVEMISQHLDYQGTVNWDRTKPVGQPRRHFSHWRARSRLNWAPRTNLLTGLARTIDALKGSPIA